jgi:hypothetical protein
VVGLLLRAAVYTSVSNIMSHDRARKCDRKCDLVQINAVRSGTVLPHMEQDPHEGAMSHPSVTSSSQSQPLSRWSNAGNPGAPTSPITGADPGSHPTAFFLVVMNTIILHIGMHKLEK